MHRKPARCWQVPSEGSEFKCDPLPSRKGGGNHSLALQCVPVAGLGSSACWTLFPRKESC